MITRILLMLALGSVVQDGPKKLPLPGYISPQLRKVLDKRMEHHGRGAIGLSIAVVLLAHDDVAELALGLAEQPGLARPRLGEEGTLNATLPAQFFSFQDQLRERAKELAAAAKQKNNAKMHAALGRVTETCMTCHAVYLNGPGSEEKWWPRDE
ncbi:MAG: cytochrome c [Deltaproteobacteria bacterium]|nr:cytochrome c [Deltaproteobacteria bacterium]